MLNKRSSQVIGVFTFGTLSFLFLIGVFFFSPDSLPFFKQRILAVISALLAGLFGYFFTGAVAIAIDADSDITVGKTAIQAGGGSALFLVVLLWWFSGFAPVGVEPPVKPVDSCQVVAPDISAPVNGEDISSPFEVCGTVSYRPKKSYLWVTAFNPNMHQYTDLVPVAPDNKKQWQAELRFVGGKIKDRYTIEVVLADKAANEKLRKLRATNVKELSVSPGSVQTCSQVEVTLAH